jgi:hypothetical protein
MCRSAGQGTPSASSPEECSGWAWAASYFSGWCLPQHLELASSMKLVIHGILDAGFWSLLCMSYQSASHLSSLTSSSNFMVKSLDWVPGTFNNRSYCAEFLNVSSFIGMLHYFLLLFQLLVQYFPSFYCWTEVVFAGYSKHVTSVSWFCPGYFSSSSS